MKTSEEIKKEFTQKILNSGSLLPESYIKIYLDRITHEITHETNFSLLDKINFKHINP